MVAPLTRPWFDVHDRRMRAARRLTGRRHGVAALVAVGFALSAAVVPTERHVVADGPAVEPAPTAGFVPFAAARALTAMTLTITDGPFSVDPATLDFGTYFVGSPAQEIVTLVNDTGREAFFEVTGVAGVTVTGIAGCGAFLPFVPADGVIASLYLDVAGTCDISVSIDNTVPATINGELVLTDTDSLEVDRVALTAAVIPVGPPTNDDWADAQDVSALAVPPFVAAPGPFPGTVRPRDTVRIDGTTENATYEVGEYDPGRPGGSVWYTYTAPPGGFAGRLGYRATPGFFVAVTTEHTSVTESRRAHGNTWGPSSIQHVRMEPGHTVWFSVFNESPSVDPGRFTLELFQAPDEQDSIDQGYSGTGAGEFALSTDFSLFGDGDTHHLTPDLPGGAPNGWATLRFAVPGSLSVTYRSATALTLDSFGSNEGSDRPLGLQIYRSPQPERISDPTQLGTPIAVGVGSVSAAPVPGLIGPRWETTATVQVTPGRYYWTYETDPLGPTFFLTDVRFTASGSADTEPPTATIITPPDGARYPVGSVPSSVVSTCTDNQGPSSSFVTVDGIETTSLVTTVGSHTVSLECTDSAGNTVTVTSTYLVFAPTGPCVIVETQTVDFGEVAVGSSSSDRAVVVRSCSDAPIRLAVSVSDATSSGAQTWLASTSTVPAANQFTWSVVPPGAPSPIPVGPVQTAVGPILAPGASRTDAHRIALGPTGPGLGTRFRSTFTYTAIQP